MAAIKLTTQERVLLHLSDFRDMESGYEFPLALTQAEIAYAVGVDRKHISRYLRGLVEEGLVVERKARVEGKKQRMLVYYLDGPGWTRALKIKRYVGAQHIPVNVDGKIRKMTLKEIDDSTTVHLTFSDIVREAMDEDTLIMEDLERIEERRARNLDRRVHSMDAYARALLAVWRDGRVTATERLLMEEIRRLLEVPPKEHSRLEAEIVERLANEATDAEALYRRVYARSQEQGLADARGRELMEILRRELGLSLRQVKEIEESV